MKNLFLLIYLSFTVNIQAQKIHPQIQFNKINNNIPYNTTSNIRNTQELNINKNSTEKEFNLTEKIENFYSNTTNDKKEELKNIPHQEQDKIETIEQVKKSEKDDKEMNKLKEEKDEFDKQIEIFTLSDFTTLELPSKNIEIIYYKVNTPCTLKFAFYLSDSEKNIHMTLNGPDDKGRTKDLKTFTNKNFLFYEYKAKHIGQYTFNLDNSPNSDKTEISFAIKNDLKVDGNIGMKKLDKITDYLNEIDEKINKMRMKQNIINKKTDAHNESVNKHNKEILIYSIVEVGTMVLIFVAQLFYIKSKVDKI